VFSATCDYAKYILLISYFRNFLFHFVDFGAYNFIKRKDLVCPARKESNP